MGSQTLTFAYVFSLLVFLSHPGDPKRGFEGPDCIRFHKNVILRHVLLKYTTVRIIQFLYGFGNNPPPLAVGMDNLFSSQGRSDINMGAAIWLESRPGETYCASWVAEVHGGSFFVAYQYVLSILEPLSPIVVFVRARFGQQNITN
jgi:hypothetical protein